MSENNPPLPPVPPAKDTPPARSMADIARMFLDGARPISEQGTPRRVGPNQRGEPAGDSAFDALPSAIQGLVARSERERSDDMPARLARVLLAIGGTDGEARNLERITAAAAGLAKKQQAAVGILSLHNGQLTIDVAGAQGGELPAIKFAGGLADVQIARALFMLRHSVAHWIIAAPPADSAEFPRLAAAIPDWLLATSTANDSVVATYQEFKRALGVSSPQRDPIIVMLSADPVNAGAVHARLQRATAEFLGKDLPLAAVAPMAAASAVRVAELEIGIDPAEHTCVYAAVLDELCGTVAQAQADVGEAFEDEVIEAPPAAAHQPAIADLSFDEAIGDVSIDIDGSLDAATAAAVDLALHADSSVAANDALFDHLTNVLDSDEREALNAELFAQPEEAVAAGNRAPDVDLPEQRETSPTTQNCSTRPAASLPVDAFPSLRAFDLADAPLDRAAQWQAVEKSIPDLAAGSVVLEARPPMAWAAESCVAVDAGGALHVWMLYKDGVSWFALREWADEHRAILALTRRDCIFAAEKAVAVHVVMPLETKVCGSGKTAGDQAAKLLRGGAEGLCVYRLRQIEWGAKRGILVIPLS